MFAATSLLFVPGARPDRFDKARVAGAGLTAIDLEDAVAADAKDAARNDALAAIASGDGYALRMNGVATRAGIADLHALADAETLPAVMLVPMVEAAAEIAVVRGALGERCPALVPLVETPRGLRNALAIAQEEGVTAMMFGGGDFAGELGVRLSWEPLLAARQQLLLACAEAHVPAIDVPYIHLDDEEGLKAECAKARALGFAAKAAIHPRQVAAIDAAFEPSERECNEAAEALRAFDEGGGSVVRFNGRMLEAPLVKHYRAILARKERTTVHA
ncbi:MAG: aldolase/citrate lyase family protein [Pacificimonas sp.]|jgi:citrate lyase beta subunit|nr:aldolase/citrate lyase family protein [Pacificimonas sp.]